MDPQLHMPMFGAASRVVPVVMLAHEFALTERETREFLDRLDVAILRVGGDNGYDAVDLSACELAWHRAANPRLFAKAQDPVAILDAIAKMYSGAHRAALRTKLHDIGQEIFPDIKHRKRSRQAKRHQRSKTQESS